MPICIDLTQAAITEEWKLVPSEPYCQGIRDVGDSGRCILVCNGIINDQCTIRQRWNRQLYTIPLDSYLIGKRNRLRLKNASFRGSNWACATCGMATLTKLACFSDLVTFVTAVLDDRNLGGNFDWNLWSWGEQFSWLTCCLQPSVRREVMMYDDVKCQF